MSGPAPAPSSGNLIVDRRYRYAVAAMAEGDVAAAADLLAQTVDLAPHWVPLWFALGDALSRLAAAEPHHLDGAVRAFREVLARDPDDRLGAAVRLAWLTGKGSAIPPAHVAALFDQYADRFDDHLVGTLGYRAPAVLRAAVEPACGALDRPLRFDVVLDLGCGTGLAGLAFRDLAATLIGVDLSAGMLRQAAARAIYDRLVEAEIVRFLDDEPPASAGLVLAADVFVYLGDLARPLGAAARVLRPGGLLAFTTQRTDGHGFTLGEDLRYAHSAAYLAAAAERSGLAIVRLETVSTRREHGADVPGVAIVLAKPP